MQRLYDLSEDNAFTVGTKEDIECYHHEIQTLEFAITTVILRQGLYTSH